MPGSLREKGTSLIVVRHPKILDLIEQGVRSGSIATESLTAEEAAQSQDAGLRHRREGLAFRLWLAAKRGKWYPTKRVAPDPRGIVFSSKLIYLLRMVIAGRSGPAFAAAKKRGEWKLFEKKMRGIRKLYKLAYRLRRRQQKANRKS